MSDGNRDAEMGRVDFAEENNPDRDTAAWVKAEMEAEVARLKSVGQLILPVRVKNCCTVQEEKHVMLNRVETAVNFDFTKVKQILLSEPKPCPDKPNFSLVFLVLVTRKPLPMLAPYIFDTTARNDLKHWVLINNKLLRARHKVNTFSTVRE